MKHALIAQPIIGVKTLSPDIYKLSRSKHLEMLGRIGDRQVAFRS
jgi:hypothetical protein